LLSYGQLGWAEPSSDGRARIAASIASRHPGYAQAVKDERTGMAAVEAPFRRARIWRFEKTLPTRPLIFFVASNDEGAVVLTGEAEAFNRLIDREALALTNAADAVALIKLFDETTRDGARRHLHVPSVDAIPFRPGLVGRLAQIRDGAKQSLAARIQPSPARRENGKWSWIDHVVDGDVLMEEAFTVAESGRVSVKQRALRDDLPLVYAN
jgi:hypothetical protein